MRTLQPRAWLSGLGQASRAAWRRECLQHIYSSAYQHAEAEAQPADASGRHEADAQFLQLLSQSFAPSSTFESTPPSRPLLANLPASAELMERAVPQEAAPYPVYDLPTFLETAYPYAGVQPRNPSYDWRSWSRSHLRVTPATSAAGSICPPAAATATGSRLTQRPHHHNHQQPQQQQQGQGQQSAQGQARWEAPQQLALLLQVDAHMQQPASREAIVRLAKLELAHLWYYQQQQQQQRRRHGGGSVRSAPEEPVASQGEAGVDRQLASAATPSSSLPSAVPTGENASMAAAATAASPGEAAATKEAGDGAGADGDDDIFALADRKARERAAQQEWQQQQQQRAAAAAGAGAGGAGAEASQQQQALASRDPLSSLPPDMQLRLRELQRRAEAFGAPRGPLADVLRNVGEAFSSRVVLDGDGARGGSSGGGVYDSGALVDALARDLAARGGRVGAAKRLQQKQQQENAADRLIFEKARLEAAGGSGDGGSGGAALVPFWAETPMLSYTDNVLALAHREGAAARRSAAAGPQGSKSLAACVESLRASRGLPPTPMLSLLVDYLQTKYQDLLHAWEMAGRLQEATSQLESEAARRQATLQVQASRAGLLPAALLIDLESSWGAAAAAFKPATLGLDAAAAPSAAAAVAHKALTAPLEWRAASALLSKGTAAAAAASGAAAAAATAAAAAAAASGDLRSAVQHALAPLLAAAAERHRALLGGGGDGSDSAAAAALPPPPPLPLASDSAAGAAGVVCFRETLILDASSGFEDGSHDSRVSLEFNLDRLAAAEPALGGTWGRRFLERLLAPPMWPAADPRVPGGSSARSGSARRAAAVVGGSMAGRRRRGAAARSAVMASMFSVDVSYSFCRRTGTATLTTARYGSREANRKLLLERYAEVLKATVQAAAVGTETQR